MYGYLSALLPITHNYINLSILFFYWRKLSQIREKTKSWRRFGNISPKEEEERQSWRIFFCNKIAIILKLTIEWYLTITAWKYIDFICKKDLLFNHWMTAESNYKQVKVAVVWNPFTAAIKLRMPWNRSKVRAIEG